MALDPAKMQRIEQILAQTMSKMGGAMQSPQGAPGGGGPQSSPGSVPNIGIPVGGTAGATGGGSPGGGGGGGGAIPSPRPVVESSLQVPTSQFIPNQGPSAPGMEFGTKGAAKSATAFSVAQSFADIMNKVEQTDFQRKQNQAKTYFQEALDAQNRGDMQTFTAIVNDPKVKQLWKKFGMEMMPEKPSPERKGIEQAFAEAARKRNQKQQSVTQTGVSRQPSQAAQLTAQQLANQLAVAQKQSQLLQDPKELEAAARGSRLTSDEQRQAELMQNGFMPNQFQLMQLDAKTKIETLKYAYLNDKLQKDLQLGLQKAQLALQGQQARAGATVQSAQLHKEAMDDRTQLMRDTLQKLNDNKMLMYEGKVNDANVRSAKNFEDYAKSLHTLASKQTDKDKAAEYEADAKKADALFKAASDQTVSPQDVQMQILLHTLGFPMTDEEQ